MSRKFTDKVTIKCDMCNEKNMEFPIPDGHKGSEQWASEATENGWMIIMTSPVPFLGLDVCPECLAGLIKNIGQYVFPIYDIIVEKNENIAVHTTLKKFLSQVAIACLNESNKNGEEIKNDELQNADGVS